MRRFLKNNGLSLTLFGIFLAILVGQSLIGFHVHNHDQQEHGQAVIGYIDYLQTPSFVEVTFENWESEFLQMAAYILLTVFLFQKGSAESKDPEQNDTPDELTSDDAADAPWPVRRGGLILKLYENSLLSAFVLLFAMSFTLHAIGGAGQYSEEQLQHGGQAVSTLTYLTTAQFWYESLQNWQSEFLAVGLIVVLSVFLRQRGSPESKPVASPHGKTGSR